jgi:hypothetical protein
MEQKMITPLLCTAFGLVAAGARAQPGTLDPSFGSAGLVTTSLSGGSDTLKDLATAPFGDGRWTITDFFGEFDFAAAVVIATGSRIVGGGTVGNPSNGTQLRPGGVPDAGGHRAGAYRNAERSPCAGASPPRSAWPGPTPGMRRSS